MPGDSKAKLDRERFGTTALAHIDSIYRFALYMIQDEKEAQKLVLYTYLKACKSLDGYSDRKCCRIWLLAILNDVIAKTSSILPGAKGRDNQGISSVAMKGFSGVLSGEIAAAIGELPASDRAVVLLSDMEGLSYEEIANIVGYSVEDVSFRLLKCRRLLIKRLKTTLDSRGWLPEQR